MKKRPPKAPPTIDKPIVHKMHSTLLRRPVRILVVGCGGNGSEIVGGLPYLHQALLAWGHPGGLEVLLMDGDVVSPTNIVRQVFAPADVGHHKATVLVNRLNAFWGLNWMAIAQPLAAAPPLVENQGDRRTRQRLGADIVIGCVDSRAARKVIRDRIRHDGRVNYWLDLGNEASTGQFVLGTPTPADHTWTDGYFLGVGPDETPRVDHMPTVDLLYPETVDAAADRKDTLPSCSAQEALERQEPFVNRVLAANALAMLTRLFRYGQLAHHGGFVNLTSGRMVPMPIAPVAWTALSRGRIRPVRKAS